MIMILLPNQAGVEDADVIVMQLPPASEWLSDQFAMCESCSQRLWKMLPMDFDPVQITCELRSAKIDR